MNLNKNNIPLDLRRSNIWVNWNFEDRSDNKGEIKKTKVLYHPSGYKAKSNNESTWSNFQTCFNNSHNFDGIGLIINKGYIGIDFDDCYHTDWHYFNEPHGTYISKLQGYKEFSPSGHGTKVVVYCPQVNDLPYFKENPEKTGFNARSFKGGAIEFYRERRFFTITTNIVEDDNLELRNLIENSDTLHNFDIIKALLKEIKPDIFNPPPKQYIPIIPNTLTEEQILEKARNSKSGEKFKRLYDYGDRSAYESASEADMALMCILAFWTGKDKVKMDNLFRKSSLFRAEGKSELYFEKLVEQAYIYTKESYTPFSRRKKILDRFNSIK